MHGEGCKSEKGLWSSSLPGFTIWSSGLLLEHHPTSFHQYNFVMYRNCTKYIRLYMVSLNQTAFSRAKWKTTLLFFHQILASLKVCALPGKCCGLMCFPLWILVDCFLD